MFKLYSKEESLQKTFIILIKILIYIIRKKDEYQKIKKNNYLDLDEVLRLKNIMNTKKKYL